MRFFTHGFIILCICLTGCSSGSQEERDMRVATFNIAMGLKQAGQLSEALASGSDQRLHQVAEILQRVRPDIVLLNEFDYDLPPHCSTTATWRRGTMGNPPSTTLSTSVHRSIPG